MQAQYHPPPFHYHDLYLTQPTYHVQGEPSNYFPTAGLDLSGFSRGSSLSYPHQGFEHFADRGGDLARLSESSSSLPSAGPCATGMNITENQLARRGFCQSEGLPEFSLEQRWRWDPHSEPLHGALIAPVDCVPPMHQPHQEFQIDKSRALEYVNEAPVVLSPAAQLPTPASMAILLNPNSRPERNSPQLIYPSLPVNTRDIQDEPPLATPCDTDTEAARPAKRRIAVTSSTANASRQKRHPCTMCHKRFDRPSTLRKHLLVHTGEKSFVCDKCGRRFGVASNRNRHGKVCPRKSARLNLARGASPQLTPPIDETLRDSSPSTSDTTSSDLTGRSELAFAQQEPPARRSKAPNAPKRRRRAPSPSNWIPASLLSFDLSPPESIKATPVPLPPVRRNLPKEERDSWDENVALSPYHPQGWKDVLPGPGLGPGLGWKDLRNLNLGGNGGYILGRVLVF